MSFWLFPEVLEEGSNPPTPGGPGRLGAAAHACCGLGAGVRNGPSGPAGGRRCAQPSAHRGLGRGAPWAGSRVQGLAGSFLPCCSRGPNEKRQQGEKFSPSFPEPIFPLFGCFPRTANAMATLGPSCGGHARFQGNLRSLLCGGRGVWLPEEVVAQKSLGDAGLPGYWPRNYWL